MYTNRQKFGKTGSTMKKTKTLPNEKIIKLKFHLTRGDLFSYTFE